MPNESGTWIMYGVSWDDPEESAKRITKHIMDTYPIATNEQIRNIIGMKPGERKNTKNVR